MILARFRGFLAVAANKLLWWCKLIAVTREDAREDVGDDEEEEDFLEVTDAAEAGLASLASLPPAGDVVVIDLTSVSCRFEEGGVVFRGSAIEDVSVLMASGMGFLLSRKLLAEAMVAQMVDSSWSMFMVSGNL